MRNLMVKAIAWKQARPVAREEGQTVIEYALIVGVISIALIIAMGAFGSDLITNAKSKLTSYAGTI